MFYPIEDEFELATLRSLISPFMINIQKCFSTSFLDRHERGRIVDDVINSISPVVDRALLNSLNRIIGQPENRTLCLEQGALRQISLRLIYNKKNKISSVVALSNIMTCSRGQFI